MSADKPVHFDPEVLTIADLKAAASKHVAPATSGRLWWASGGANKTMLTESTAYFNEGAGDLLTCVRLDVKPTQKRAWY